LRIVSLTIAGVAVAGLSVAAYFYWEHAALYPDTDDAYVNANVVRVAPLVAGRVTEVHVRNQQHVAAAAPLFDIDPEPFALAVRQAEAQLAMARQDTTAGAAAVRVADADVNNREVLLQNAAANAERTRRLVAKGFLSHQAGDDAAAAQKSAAAELASSQAKARQARAQLGRTDDRNDRVQLAAAALAQARLNLDHTRMRATCEGDIAELSLRPGNTVQENVPLFALICSHERWVDANFKETELERIRSGQPVQIRVDSYPGHVFEGRVENVGGAAGAAFSLLPPQNATGNWVKVTQRVPVRILVTKLDSGFPLRVGTSATVTVDTTSLDQH
jgi:membrane fusion protein (multidrug efflux system)